MEGPWCQASRYTGPDIQHRLWETEATWNISHLEAWEGVQGGTATLSARVLTLRALWDPGTIGGIPKVLRLETPGFGGLEARDQGGSLPSSSISPNLVLGSVGILVPPKIGSPAPSSSRMGPSSTGRGEFSTSGFCNGRVGEQGATVLFYGFPPDPQVQDGRDRSGGTPECGTEDLQDAGKTRVKFKLMLPALGHEMVPGERQEFMPTHGCKRPPS